MPTSHRLTTDPLTEQATDLRAVATDLESFASTLHRRTASVAWEGPAADRFRHGVTEHEALTARAVDLLRQLAARMTALAEDVRDLRSHLAAERTGVLDELEPQVHSLEKLAASLGVSPGTLLSPTAIQALVHEGDHYQSLGGELSALAAI
ncbi:MAG: WXG100 family type VII secretion target [Acidimicrobiales bacterium]